MGKMEKMKGCKKASSSWLLASSGEYSLHLLRDPTHPTAKTPSKVERCNHAASTPNPGPMAWNVWKVWKVWNMVPTSSSQNMRRPVAHPTPSSFAPPRTSHMLQCYKCWRNLCHEPFHFHASIICHGRTEGGEKIQTFYKLQRTHRDYPTWLDVLGVVSDSLPPVLSGYGYPQGVRDSIDGVAWRDTQARNSQITWDAFTLKILQLETIGKKWYKKPFGSELQHSQEESKNHAISACFPSA